MMNAENSYYHDEEDDSDGDSYFYIRIACFHSNAAGYPWMKRNANTILLIFTDFFEKYLDYS